MINIYILGSTRQIILLIMPPTISPLTMSKIKRNYTNRKENETIVALRKHWGGIDMFGINEIFAIAPFSKCREYGFRFDETKYYRKYVGRNIRLVGLLTNISKILFTLMLNLT
jgi:predicted Zn-ribbon and HTH transcriptional regulator